MINPVCESVPGAPKRLRDQKIILGGFRQSAALFTFGEDGGVKPLAKGIRKLVKLMAPVDLDGFAGCVQRNDAVFTTTKVFFQILTQLGGYFVVDKVIELG